MFFIPDALADSRLATRAVGRSGVLFSSVFDEVVRKPLDDVGAVVKVRRGRRHLLSTGRALCRNGMQVVVVADGEFRDHVGFCAFMGPSA